MSMRDGKRATVPVGKFGENNLVPLKGLEPPTPSLRMTCSTS